MKKETKQTEITEYSASVIKGEPIFGIEIGKVKMKIKTEANTEPSGEVTPPKGEESKTSKAEGEVNEVQSKE